MSRRLKVLLPPLLATSVLAVWLLWPKHTAAPAAKAPAQVCNSASAPCIELNDANNKPTGIKFNDFRFGKPGCIYYRMTTADQFKQYCGGYNMIWIGPGQPPGVNSKV